jgi:hypothetical protein
LACAFASVVSVGCTDMVANVYRNQALKEKELPKT